MEPYWYRAAHQDVDAFASAVPGFALAVRQLDRGPYASEMCVVGSRHTQICWAGFSRTLEFVGDLPLGMRTFVVSTRDDLVWTWRGQAVHGSELLLYPSDATVDILSRPGWAAFALSIDTEHLHGVLIRAGLDPRVLAVGERHPRAPGELDVLRRLLALALQAPPGMDVARTLDEEIPTALARLLRGGEPGARAALQAREALVLRARRFIRGALREAPSVADVEAAVGTSGRTLRRAFHEHVGVSPKAFLHAQRLNGVRRSLRRAAGESVREVAGRYGFWHMGQFAADYRRLFGELPSATLSAARGADAPVGHSNMR